ncbi:MAG: hypothetical protein MHPSP_000460 [Paramarteilia canceri]
MSKLGITYLDLIEKCLDPNNQKEQNRPILNGFFPEKTLETHKVENQVQIEDDKNSSSFENNLILSRNCHLLKVLTLTVKYLVQLCAVRHFDPSSQVVSGRSLFEHYLAHINIIMLNIKRFHNIQPLDLASHMTLTLQMSSNNDETGATLLGRLLSARQEKNTN